MSHLLLQSSAHEFASPSSLPLRRARVTLNVGPVAALLIMMGVIALLGLVSLTHLNAQSTKGYLINQLEDENQTLVEDREVNDMLILQARSIHTIQSTPRVQAMVKPSQITFLDSLTAFAKTDNP